MSTPPPSRSGTSSPKATATCSAADDQPEDQHGDGSPLAARQSQLSAVTVLSEQEVETMQNTLQMHDDVVHQQHMLLERYVNRIAELKRLLAEKPKSAAVAERKDPKDAENGAAEANEAEIKARVAKALKLELAKEGKELQAQQRAWKAAQEQEMAVQLRAKLADQETELRAEFDAELERQLAQQQQRFEAATAGKHGHTANGGADLHHQQRIEDQQQQLDELDAEMANLRAQKQLVQDEAELTRRMHDELERRLDASRRENESLRKSKTEAMDLLDQAESERAKLVLAHQLLEERLLLRDTECNERLADLEAANKELEYYRANADTNDSPPRGASSECPASVGTSDDRNGVSPRFMLRTAHREEVMRFEALIEDLQQELRERRKPLSRLATADDSLEAPDGINYADRAAALEEELDITKHHLNSVVERNVALTEELAHTHSGSSRTPSVGRNGGVSSANPTPMHRHSAGTSATGARLHAATTASTRHHHDSLNNTASSLPASSPIVPRQKGPTTLGGSRARNTTTNNSTSLLNRHAQFGSTVPVQGGRR